MITFSCKSISEEELIRCSFDLNKTEYNLLIFLMSKNSSLTVSSISAGMGLERTSIQKAVKGLVQKGLVRRTQKNLAKGGYIFLYTPDNKDEIKSRMKYIVRKWYKAVERSIDSL
ncbi:MAG: MarR family transcriptional regulator [Candidatus Aenigmarchaeota archaeon]|nr:MarR family transcriptional regulator [Candidatus Aenigmarchaeota archaeon]